MKRNFAILCAAALVCGSFGVFAACEQQEQEEIPSEIKLYLPDGTPMLAVAELLADGMEYEGQSISFTAELQPASDIAKVFASYADCNFAVMPTVSAATIYSKGTEVQLASANVFGNLYVVGIGEADSLAALEGKLVYTTTGTTVAMMQYLLEENGIAWESGTEASEGVVTLCSKSAASDYLPLIKQAQANGTEAYGVLGEPAVTQCMTKVATESKIVVDLQAEYEALTGEAGYPQASLIVRTSFAQEHPALVHAIVEKLSGNESYLKDNAAGLQDFFKELGSSGLSGIAYTAETIDRCHLDVIGAQDVKEAVLAYLASMQESGVPVGEVDDGFFLAK